MALQDLAVGDGEHGEVRTKWNANMAELTAHMADTSSPHGASMTQDTLAVQTSLALPDGRTWTAVNAQERWLPAGEAWVAPGYQQGVSHDLVYLDSETGDLQWVQAGAGQRLGLQAEADSGGTYSEKLICEWRLPPDFKAWPAANCVSVALVTSDSGGGAYVDFATYRRPSGAPGTPVAGGTKAGQKSSSAGVYEMIQWSSAQLAGGTWAPGDVLVIEATLNADYSGGTSYTAALAEVIIAWEVGA